MAEVVGLAASIIQIAGAGTKLSVALYNFTTSAVRADQDIKDIADDVELTSNALESVGRVFETEDAKSIISKKAIQDANNIIKKCESVFNEISEIIEKRRKPGKDGRKSLSLMGKLAFPMKEQRIELNRRRLESLKNSLVLLLHVLQLAQGQARGKLEKSVMEEEREKIRELHQRQQDSLKSLQALESKFCRVTLDDEETLNGSVVISRVPTMDLMARAQPSSMPPLEKTDSQATLNTFTIDLSAVDDSETSESDATITDDEDEDEQLSLEELSRCAKQVQRLLKRITVLQNDFEGRKKTVTHRKKRVHKIYQRFCRKFESNIDIAPKPQSAQPNLFGGDNRSNSKYSLEPITLERSYKRRKATHSDAASDGERDSKRYQATKALRNEMKGAGVPDDQVSGLRLPVTSELNDWSAPSIPLNLGSKSVPKAGAVLPPEISVDVALSSQQASLKASEIKSDTDGLTSPISSPLQRRHRAKSDAFNSSYVPPSNTQPLFPLDVQDAISLGEWNFGEVDELSSFDFDSFLHTNDSEPFIAESIPSQPPKPSLSEIKSPRPDISQESGEANLEDVSVSNEKKVGKTPVVSTSTEPPFQFTHSMQANRPQSIPAILNPEPVQVLHKGGYEKAGLVPPLDTDACPHETTFGGLCVDCGEDMTKVDYLSPDGYASLSVSKGVLRLSSTKNDATVEQNDQPITTPLNQTVTERTQQFLTKMDIPPHIQQNILKRPLEQQRMIIKQILLMQRSKQQGQLSGPQQLQMQQMQQQQQQQQSALDSQTAPPIMTLTGSQQQSPSSANTRSLQLLAVQQMRRHIEQQGIPEGQNAQAYQQHLVKVLFAKLKMDADRLRAQSSSAAFQKAPPMAPQAQTTQAVRSPYSAPQNWPATQRPGMSLQNMQQQPPFPFPGSSFTGISNNLFENTGFNLQMPAQSRFARDPPVQGNHALEDYQMRLMILEQQNKKRLMMARQEQDAGAPDDPQAMFLVTNKKGQSSVSVNQMKRSGIPQSRMGHNTDDERKEVQSAEESIGIDLEESITQSSSAPSKSADPPSPIIIPQVPSITSIDYLGFNDSPFTDELFHENPKRQRRSRVPAVPTQSRKLPISEQSEEIRKQLIHPACDNCKELIGSLCNEGIPCFSCQTYHTLMRPLPHTDCRGVDIATYMSDNPEQLDLPEIPTHGGTSHTQVSLDFADTYNTLFKPEETLHIRSLESPQAKQDDVNFSINSPQLGDGNASDWQSLESELDAFLNESSDDVDTAASSAIKHTCACGRSYTNLQHLQQHQKVHTTQELHTCEHPSCGKHFRRLDLLKQHQERHEALEKQLEKPTMGLPLPDPIIPSLSVAFNHQPASCALPSLENMAQESYSTISTPFGGMGPVDWKVLFPDEESNSGHTNPVPGLADYANLAVPRLPEEYWEEQEKSKRRVCDQCGKLFRSEEEFGEHVQSHLKEHSGDRDRSRAPGRKLKEFFGEEPTKKPTTTTRLAWPESANSSGKKVRKDEGIEVPPKKQGETLQLPSNTTPGSATEVSNTSSGSGQQNPSTNSHSTTKAPSLKPKKKGILWTAGQAGGKRGFERPSSPRQLHLPVGRPGGENETPPKMPSLDDTTRNLQGSLLPSNAQETRQKRPWEGEEERKEDPSNTSPKETRVRRKGAVPTLVEGQEQEGEQPDKNNQMRHERRHSPTPRPRNPRITLTSDPQTERWERSGRPIIQPEIMYSTSFSDEPVEARTGTSAVDPPPVAQEPGRKRRRERYTARYEPAAKRTKASRDAEKEAEAEIEKEKEKEKREAQQKSPNKTRRTRTWNDKTKRWVWDLNTMGVPRPAGFEREMMERTPTIRTESESEDEERDIVDILLEQWTVPVA